MSKSLSSFGDRAWTWCAGVAAAAGVVGAVVRWGWTGPIAGMILMGLCGAATAASVMWVPGRSMAARIARIGFVVGVVPTATVGLVVALGPTGLLVVLLIAGTSPAARAAVRVLRHAVPDMSGVDASDLPVAPPLVEVDSPDPQDWSLEWLASLDDGPLCLAWRHSFVLLGAAQTPEDKLAVVRNRERCLEELERRCPAGVETWLSSGARAPGNPLPFLSHRPDDVSANPDEEAC